MNFLHVVVMSDGSHQALQVAQYWVDLNSAAERRVLSQQCTSAFHAGQCVISSPVEVFGQVPEWMA